MSKSFIEEVRLIDTHTSADALEAKDAEIARLNERLENNRIYHLDGRREDVEPGSIPDGIEARDETIKILDKNVDTLRAHLAEALKVIEPFSTIAIHSAAPDEAMVVVSDTAGGFVNCGPSMRVKVKDIRAARNFYQRQSEVG